ncbi:M14 family metallopeptidase [Actomonas aquatica]|uniref:M14 metallopeptidase family protein n=1 Tax=Actomonas aquatica TaxID=2866162 RepID=A0ABZ1CCE0_9BACT|nr:M14 metallopeptidase family protein [Opitutus sp. WL0086]WRQ89060.1 M14 metallopeptidase family protein [Opitutus sp. WL0086]
MIKRPIDRLLRGAILCGLAVSTLVAAPSITPPKEMLGFNIGDDYHMANYTQISTMMKKWDEESDRLKVVNIGTTVEGRPMLMGIITSPENHAKLDYYQDISRRLSVAEMPEDEAEALAQEGKAVVWIDGGLHATETVNAQSLAEMIYQMVSLEDRETMRFLDDVILLMPIPNPDGVELVANWYMREEDPEKRSLNYLPVLYHKYVGHDNNRDSIMNNMPETINQNKVLFIDWNPQIMHNVHQTGPLGQVIFIPPFRDPFNYNFDPLIPVGIERVGAAMHARLLSKGMGGSSMRSNAPYSTWWNGGMRTAVYYHNQIGLLTEIIGNPTPGPVPLVPEKQLPDSERPMAIKPQMWHYRMSIDYMIEVERAVLDYASRNREQLLWDIYKMGRRSIEKGETDSWTISPTRVNKLKEEGARLIEELEAAGKETMTEEVAMRVRWRGGKNPTVPAELYETVLQAPDARDARGYIISKDQADFPTAVKFVNVLLKQGIFVDLATADFEVNGKTYPAGSYVVKANQSFRPAIRDMFEPQDHPIDLEYPGGPPMRPYDIAGWTPVVQMGVDFDRVFEDFDGPFERQSFEMQKPAAAKVYGPASPVGYLVSHKINDAVILTNRLMKAGEEVYWLKDERTVDGHALGTGTLWIPATAESSAIVKTAASDLGIPAFGVSEEPTGEAMKLKPIRIGLVDLYGGVMPSGWLRWMFEQYEFDYEVIFPQVLDAGNLRAAFDVIVVPSSTYSEGSRGRFRRMPEPDTIPEEYRSMLGQLTQSESIPPLKTFVAEGGTLLAIGSSSVIGRSMGLPVTDHLTEWNAQGERVPLDSKKFYVPGSILRAKFNNKTPLAYGMPSDGYVFFDSSPVFHRKDDEEIHAEQVAWFDGTDLLYSGWAMGEHYLDGGEVATSAKMGEGDLVLISIEATFRATPHGTFKLFFNGLYQGQAEELEL